MRKRPLNLTAGAFVSRTTRRVPAGPSRAPSAPHSASARRSSDQAARPAEGNLAGSREQIRVHGRCEAVQRCQLRSRAQFAHQDACREVNFDEGCRCRTRTPSTIGRLPLARALGGLREVRLDDCVRVLAEVAGIEGHDEPAGKESLVPFLLGLPVVPVVLAV